MRRCLERAAPGVNPNSYNTEVQSLDSYPAEVYSTIMDTRCDMGLPVMKLQELASDFVVPDVDVGAPTIERAQGGCVVSGVLMRQFLAGAP